jgi:predicted Ser/Thr protein kinase
MADLADGTEDRTSRPGEAGMLAGLTPPQDDATRRAPLAEPAQPPNDATMRSPFGDLTQPPDDATKRAPVVALGEDEATRRRPVEMQMAGGDGTALPVGTVLSNTYVIEAFLARGGMGEVYRARHRELGSSHAIKMIRAELARDEGVIRLFTEEAKKLRRVREDGVVAYEGLFLDEFGRRFLVMEFVDGPSLAQRLRDGPLSVDEVRSLRDRIALGLGAAHAKGIFHRDLSPDNVILVDGKTERAKVIDFGIAKSTEPGDVTVVGENFAGKYSWVAPEQLGLYGGKVDARADIYSLGLLLASAAAGRPISPAGSMAQVIAAREKVPDLSAVPAALRAELEPLLQPDPARRPISMIALPRHIPAQRLNRRVLVGSIVAIVVALGVAGGAVGWRLYTAKPGVNTPPAGPADRTAAMQALGPVLGRFECSGLRVAAGAGANAINLGGFVSSQDDVARVISAATPLTPGFPLVNQIEVVPPPFCSVRQLTAGISNTAGLVIAPDHPNGRYKIGDPLIVDLKPPPKLPRGYLLLDFVEADGSVVRMASGQGNGTPVRVGEASGERLWELGEPTGPKMLLAVVSDKPLLPLEGGKSVDAKTYLPRLREQLAAAVASGAAVSVESLPLEVVR